MGLFLNFNVEESFVDQSLRVLTASPIATVPFVLVIIEKHIVVVGLEINLNVILIQQGFSILIAIPEKVSPPPSALDWTGEKEIFLKGSSLLLRAG
ncbi:hypothetical protein HN51_019834 [Arachis hypogaea]